ncbi:MAG: 3-phosphoshikimate 1-carboxyvinyltransferase [Candidatus Omnitrophota bacterium]
MEQIKVRKIRKLKGVFSAPSDKSLSQRAVMIGAIAEGETLIQHFLDCSDSRNAITAFRNMGVSIKLIKNRKTVNVKIKGKGLNGLKAPKGRLDIGNSGTTMRLLSGILAGQKFKSVLSGDPSLSLRPMKRIILPLRKMGADIYGKKKGGQEYPPLVISGKKLKGIRYDMPIKSAQVKSAILLAGLYAQGKTRIKEIIKTRDHSERMLKLFNADIKVKGEIINLSGKNELLAPGKITLPGDISSAAFFIVGATIIKGSNITIRNVGLNPTRSYLIPLLKKMGADIRILKKNNRLKSWEPAADLMIKSSSLKGINISEKEAAYCIDELPILCVAACFAKGKTYIRGAGELRVKETDRIYSMVTNLQKMGADIVNKKNDLIISGPAQLKGAVVNSFKDHRSAMCMAIAGLLSQGQTTIKDTECIHKSFPEFMKVLKSLKKG